MTRSATKERNVRTPPFGAPHVFVLAVVEGDDPAAVYRILRSESVLGRAERADLRIDDPEISNRHCVLFVDGPLCGLRDVGSRNGTFVNGRRLRPDVLERLRHLDEIEVGSVRLVFLAGRFRPRPEP